MARRHELLYAMNSGGVDKEALSRVDLEKLRLTGEHPVANFLPRVLGPMTLRPGLKSILRIPSDVQTRMIPVQLGVGTSRILLTSASSALVVADDAIVTVPPVSTVIGTGSWTDQSTSPATATGGATLTLTATSTSAARLRQAVSVALADRTVENILRVVVSRGPVILRVGTTAGGEELFSDASLVEGTHKIAVTPGTGVATIYVEIRSETAAIARTVSSINFETQFLGGAGNLVIPTPWATYATVQALRTCQSLDVIYASDGSYEPREIQHRGTSSWSIVAHRTRKGPYLPGNARISMTPGATTGDITVTSSEPYFRVGMAGALMEVVSTTGETVTQNFTAAAQTTDYITVQGVSQGRAFYISGVHSSFVGTVVLERSFEAIAPSVWTTYESYTDSATHMALTYKNDTLDNVTAHYRLRCTAYTSGSTNMTLEYQAGVKVGTGRIVGFVNNQNVFLEVFDDLGNTNATRTWRIGAWSYDQGFPRTPVLHDGRLFWFREDDVFGSVSDDYTLHDDSTEGDSGPLWRSIGATSNEDVSWAASQNRLIVGTPTFEATIQASELDEPLSPTRYTVRKPSRRGSADVPAVEHDDGLFFVQRSGQRVYEMSAAGDATSRLSTTDMTRLIPNAASVGIIAAAVQQQPDTRLYCVLSDGTCLVLTYDKDDQVAAWTTITTTNGLIEDVCVLPAEEQDEVYFIVNRNSGQRFLEKLAPEAEQLAVGTCALLDAHKVLTGSISSITGGTQLAGWTVSTWRDGVKGADVTLNGSGVAALGATYSRVVYGLSVQADWKSVKLAYAAQLGTALGNTKIVHGAGLILANSCLDGITLGGTSDMLGPLPEIVDGATRVASQFFTHYDEDITPINGNWDPDARLHVRVNSAYGPVTIQGVVVDVETRDGVEARDG